MTTHSDTPATTRPRRTAALVLKILAWLIMAAILFTAGVLMGVVNILTPERLTPLAERIATQSLQNAVVKIDMVELTIAGTFPFVHADIENLRVLSTVSENLPADVRAELPAYTDTVLSVRGFHGGLNVMKLASDKLELSDVTIDHPAVNIVIIDSHTTNFDIIPVKEEDTEPFNWNEIPGISLKRFTIVDPSHIRFYNRETQTMLVAGFSRVLLDGSDAPVYRLNFDGDVEGPAELYKYINIPDLQFGLNGSMVWSQEKPTLLALENFEFLFSVFGGCVNTEVDFSNGVTFNKLDVVMLPLNVSEILGIVPADIAAEFDIPTPKQLKTDANVLVSAHLDAPWNIGSDTISPCTVNINLPRFSFNGYNFETPGLSAKVDVSLLSPWAVSTSLPDVKVSIDIPTTRLRWHDLKLERFAANLSVRLPRGDLKGMTADINTLELQGPSTSLKIAGKLKDITTEPFFDGTIEGRMDIGKLPAPVRNRIDGTLLGTVDTKIKFAGSTAMFNPEKFHRIFLNGDLTLENLYYISGDTTNMVDLKTARLHFGTTEKFVRGAETRADSLMRFTLNVDSGIVLHSDLAMRFKGFDIALAAQNTSESLHKGRINPMGGRLSLKDFNLLKTNDSVVLKLREVSGYTVIKAYNNDIRTPQFIFDLGAKRISTGGPESRLLIMNARTHLEAVRTPQTREAKRIAAIADSVKYVHPHLSPDSVIVLALEIHNRHRSKYPRVHEVWNNTDSLDMIDWGASPLFKRILTWWKIQGTLTSDRAGLFTPYLPLRNRLRNIDIAFNNDSINIKGLEYKIGHTDFTVNGIVSNMRRAFTSKSGRQPLRVNFDLLSGTIDINQLTETLIKGSSYSAEPKERRKFDMAAIEDDETSMEEHIARLTQDAPDTVMPILVPANLDAELSVRSNHVLYSDFELNKMSGKVLAYGGALNFQNLTASSSVGSIDLSALYTGLHPDELRFGFGLRLNDFNLHRFLKLVPAVDSLLPVMRDFSGIISADIAATTDVDRHMNIVLPSLDAAIGLKGDSLVLLDPDTFKSLARWLLFKDKKRNIIDHMDVQMIVKNSELEIYPFIFDFDRYKLGVQGYNDFNMNFSYHIAVLKSPIPFKFGINISGNPDKFKIRLGGAKFGENQIRRVAIVDTTRINLLNQINNVFKRGAQEARLSRILGSTGTPAALIDLSTDTISHADSLMFIKEGLIDAPEAVKPKKRGGRKEKRNNDTAVDSDPAVVSSLLPLAVLTGTGARRRKRTRR